MHSHFLNNSAGSSVQISIQFPFVPIQELTIEKHSKGNGNPWETELPEPKFTLNWIKEYFLNTDTKFLTR